MSAENTEQFNMEFNKRVCILPEEHLWLPYRANGVLHMSLESEMIESGHATSIVKFAPRSSFPKHQHLQGIEIYVLDGMFSDEYGDYPAGTYIRNPSGSQHSPYTINGCTLFVKKNQFHPDDKKYIVIKEKKQWWRQGIGNLRVLSLHSHLGENTALVYWPPNEKFQTHMHECGEEILVLKGMFRDEHGDYPTGTWIRNPHQSIHTPYVGLKETLILVKTGHLCI